MRNNQTQILSHVECWEHEALGTTSLTLLMVRGYEPSISTVIDHQNETRMSLKTR
jgi:hypothetical protein